MLLAMEATTGQLPPDESLSLLNLLAQVASEKLHNDPSIISSNASTGAQVQSEEQWSEQSDNTLQDCRPTNVVKCSTFNENVNTTSSNPQSDYLQLNLSQVTRLSASQLVKFFSINKDEEVRRKYYSTCALLPQSCSYEASSFGSERGARADIRKHLSAHLTELLMKYQSVAEREQVVFTSLQKKSKCDSMLRRRDKKGRPPKVALTDEQLTVNIDREARKVYRNKKLPTSKKKFLSMDGVQHDSNNNNSSFNHSYSLEKFVEDHHPTNVSTTIKKEVVFELKENANKDDTLVDLPDVKVRKKPKGRAKFIGQSKAEREKAVQLIQEMKAAGSSSAAAGVGGALECTICQPPRPFTAPSTLLSHYKSHAGICPFVCRICSSVFTRQHSLNYHLLIHENRTRFTCEDCGRKFRHPSHFKEHRRRHTGESPFVCQDCSAKFKTRNTYKRHLRTRHNKVLTTQGELVVHNSSIKDCNINVNTGPSQGSINNKSVCVVVSDVKFTEVDQSDAAKLDSEMNLFNIVENAESSGNPSTAIIPCNEFTTIILEPDKSNGYQWSCNENITVAQNINPTHDEDIKPDFPSLNNTHNAQPVILPLETKIKCAVSPRDSLQVAVPSKQAVQSSFLLDSSSNISLVNSASLNGCHEGYNNNNDSSVVLRKHQHAVLGDGIIETKPESQVCRSTALSGVGGAPYCVKLVRRRYATSGHHQNLNDVRKRPTVLKLSTGSACS